MNTLILEEIGLNKTEIKIYLALLELGQSTTTPLIRKSGIHPAKVYEFIDKLIKKGLVSYVVKSNKRYFSASEPETIREMINERKEKLEEQEKELDKIIPEMRRIKKMKESKINSEIYEGIKGVKSVYEKIINVLKKGEVQYIIGAPKAGNELVEGYLLGWHKRRIKKGIHCKYIYDNEAKEYGEVREKMPLTEVRYLPREMASPVWIEIFGEYVIIGHIKKENVVLYMIHDNEISKSYMDYFKLIWGVSAK